MKNLRSITVQIPFSINGCLATAYNRAIESAPDEWVALMDHDVFPALLKTGWYELLCRGIDQHPDAGWITCYTNRITCPHQLVPATFCDPHPSKQPNGDCHDLTYWRQVANDVYRANADSVTNVTDGPRLCGPFILTSKTAWRRVGGFKPTNHGFLGVDNEYFSAIRDAGLLAWRLDGLLMYHEHDRGTGWEEKFNKAKP